MMFTDTTDAAPGSLRKRVRNRVIAAGAIGLLALGAMLFKGLPGFGSGAANGDADNESTSKTKSEDESDAPFEYGDVVTIRVVGEGYEVRDSAGDEKRWTPISLDKIKSLVEKSPGNKEGVRVRYYVNDSAVFEAEDTLRRALESTVTRSAISAIDGEGH